MWRPAKASRAEGDHFFSEYATPRTTEPLLEGSRGQGLTVGRGVAPGRLTRR